MKTWTQGARAGSPDGGALGDLVGEVYLERLLEHLLTASGASSALLGEFEDRAKPPAVEGRCLSLHHSDDHSDDRSDDACDDRARTSVFRHERALSVCGVVAARESCVQLQGVAEAFPGDPLVAACGAEALAAVPLGDADGSVRAALVLLFRAPPQDPESIRRLLLAHAPRAAAELARLGFERRVARAEQRYRRLLERSEDGVLVLRRRLPLYANPAAARMLGYASARELCAVADVGELVSAEDQDVVARQASARSAGSQPENVFEIGALHRDGQVLPVQVSAIEVDWEGASALQVRFVDLSARKEREERERQAERMASLGKLTGGIAHDFNNLLAVILGNLELLADDVSGSAEETLRKARIAAERGAELTERLLTVARRQTLRPRTVPAAQLLEEAGGLLASVLGSGIELVLEDAGDDAVAVDPAQFQSALINLAVNARDALDDGGRVVIRTERVAAERVRERFPGGDARVATDYLCIEVADDGPGMAPEVRAHAFEPFFTTKGAQKGTGLGLSMVHGFVRQSRGQIELDSTPGAGTRVRLYLPCAEDGARGAAKAAAASSAPDAAAAAGARPRALVIEDEDGVREVAVAMLESLGLDVAAAVDGPSARAILDRERFDLLLSDVVLPAGQRGPDIVAEALGRDPTIAVLFMSGYAESSDFRRLRLDHDFHLLRKPFRFDQLRKEVEVVLGRRPLA